MFIILNIICLLLLIILALIVIVAFVSGEITVTKDTRRKNIIEYLIKSMDFDSRYADGTGTINTINKQHKEDKEKEAMLLRDQCENIMRRDK